MSATAPGKALITGGAGFIGSHLAETLLDDGWEVWVLDDLSTGASENVSAVEVSSDTNTSSGYRNAAICATEFLTTEIASSDFPLWAITIPATFSTALPAIATITKPANAREMWSLWIVGVSAWTNQSETNAEPVPAAISSTTAVTMAIRGWRSSSGGRSSDCRYCRSHAP